MSWTSWMSVYCSVTEKCWQQWAIALTRSGGDQPRTATHSMTGRRRPSGIARVGGNASSRALCLEAAQLSSQHLAAVTEPRHSRDTAHTSAAARACTLFAQRSTQRHSTLYWSFTINYSTSRLKCTWTPSPTAICYSLDVYSVTAVSLVLNNFTDFHRFNCAYVIRRKTGYSPVEVYPSERPVRQSTAWQSIMQWFLFPALILHG